ncbi:hypothetical protein QE152_g7058 [Popillia japonica]|uniref:Uncharacterized protein n=1 Tax=Popillia japonica TaxID=7064 RepID=A0AAW1MI29_POPJA
MVYFTSHLSRKVFSADWSKPLTREDGIFLFSNKLILIFLTISTILTALTVSGLCSIRLPPDGNWNTGLLSPTSGEFKFFKISKCKVLNLLNNPMLMWELIHCWMRSWHKRLVIKTQVSLVCGNSSTDKRASIEVVIRV